jgi:opacity protein-like surface antigen
MKQLVKALTAIAGLAAASGSVMAADAPAAEAPVFDIGIEITGSTDYMDTGVTNSDHKPSGGITISPSYGIFYGSIYAATIDYGPDYPEPKIETTFTAGATPVFGDISVDFNLARRIKFDDPTADRWLPYLTGTYTFNDNFNASVGVGYYAYDDEATVDFWELYIGSTLTLDSGAYLTTEFYWEPDSDGANNEYIEPIATLGIPFLEKFEAIGKVGYEYYEDESYASYLWYEARLNYAFNDHIKVGVAYHGNDLGSGADCVTQAYTDCDDSIFATVTLSGNLSDLSK